MDHARASNKNYDVTEVAYTKENIKDFFWSLILENVFVFFQREEK